MSVNRTCRAIAGAAALALPLSLGLLAPQAFAADHHPADPFGSACASVPKSGSGSLNGMAKDPVATAASHNPSLSTLVTAVKKAGLVDTLNSAEHITVFAPTNEAFAKVPKADLNKLLGDKAQLTKVLTYHVVGQTVTPKQFAHGSFKTLEGAKIATTVDGKTYTVNKSAKVVCGDIKTANATVYLIDTVLMPPK